MQRKQSVCEETDEAEDETDDDSIAKSDEEMEMEKWLKGGSQKGMLVVVSWGLF
jgi:hypothetical protein